MRLEDPRKRAAFVVRMTGAAGVGKTTLLRALLEFPQATDDDLARLQVLDAGEESSAEPSAAIYVVRGKPRASAREDLAAASGGAPITFVAVHAMDLEKKRDGKSVDAWAKLVDPSRVYGTATPPRVARARGPARVAIGIDELRAALVLVAMDGIEVSIERARRAKRPYATGIVASAALATAAEGFLPGAAAFVLATQLGAISSLYYLYTGKWMSRAQALSLIPMFATGAAGSSAFLVAKSFFPPTGVADVLAAGVAAGVAASMTIAMLGAVTWVLERGYSLEETEQLKTAFKRLQAKTKAERAEIARNKHRWTDKTFWAELVRRTLFE